MVSGLADFAPASTRSRQGPLARFGPSSAVKQVVGFVPHQQRTASPWVVQGCLGSLKHRKRSSQSFRSDASSIRPQPSVGGAQFWFEQASQVALAQGLIRQMLDELRSSGATVAAGAPAAGVGRPRRHAVRPIARQAPINRRFRRHTFRDLVSVTTAGRTMPYRTGPRGEPFATFS